MIGLAWRSTAPVDDLPVVEVAICGTLNGDATERLAELLDGLVSQHPQHLIINLAACPFVDAAAIEILLRTHRRVRLAGGLLTLHEPSPRVRQLLRLARVDGVLDTRPPAANGQPVGSSTGKD